MHETKERTRLSDPGKRILWKQLLARAKRRNCNSGFFLSIVKEGRKLASEQPLEEESVR